MHDGKLAPIPFQIDQMNSGGSFVLPQGPEPVVSSHPDVLDARDEVVMMIADLGERTKPNSPLPSDALEIEMNDPLEGPPRYAYIATDAHPALSPLHYVDYDSAKNTVETDRYRFGYTHGVPTDYAPQSRAHENGPNLLDRFKIRVRATVLKLFHFNVNEDNVDNRLLAWKVGADSRGASARRIRCAWCLASDRLRSPTTISFIATASRIRSSCDFHGCRACSFGDIKVRMDLDFIGLDGYAIAWSRMNDRALQHRRSASAEDREIRSAASGMDRTARRRPHDHPDHRATSDLRLLDRRLYLMTIRTLPIRRNACAESIRGSATA